MPPLAAALLLLAFQPAGPELSSTAQALSPDGKLFAFSVSDGSVRVLTLAEGRQVRALYPGKQPVVALAWNPDGTELAAVERNGVLRLHTLADVRPRFELGAGEAVLPVWSAPEVAFVDGGARILQSGGQARVRLIDAADGSLVREFLAGADAARASDAVVQALAISLDRAHCALGDAGGMISVRSTHDGALEFGPTRFPSIHAIAFEPTGTQIAVGSGDDSLRLFDLRAGGAPLELRIERDSTWGSSIGSVSFDSSGTRVLVNHFERGITRLWDLAHEKLIWENEAEDLPDAESARLRVLDGGKLALAASGRVIDLDSGGTRDDLRRKFGKGVWRSSGTLGWICSQTTITIVDAASGELRRTIHLATLPPLPGLSSQLQSISPDGRRFAFTLDDGSLHVCELAEAHETYSLRNVTSTSTQGRAEVEHISWSPDSSRLALITIDDDVWVFEAADGKVLARFWFEPLFPGDADSLLSPHAAGLRFVEFLGGSSRLLIGGGNLHTSILDAENGSPLYVDRVRDPANLCALSPDRTRFAIAQRDGTITLHLSTDGGQQGPGLRCKGPVHALAFDPTGRMLAVGAGDCSVHLVSPATGAELRTLSLCDEDLTGELAIGSVEFAPDGRSLLATSFPWWVARAWELEKGTVLWSHDCSGGDDAPTLAAFTGDPSVVFVGAQGTRVDRASGKVLSSLGMGRFLTQGNRCWTREGDAFRIFDASDGKLLAEIPLVTR